MVEIRYGEQYEVIDLAGQTVSEARERFRAEFGIPEKATARLNGTKVKGSAEFDTALDHNDKLIFSVAKSKAAYLVGAMLLALVVTGGVFASGFINASDSLTGNIVESNFADVSVNTTGMSSISWDGYGFFKGSISASGSGTPIFNIDTSSGYTGDLVVTVSLGNADQLAKTYRMLALKLDMGYADGSNMDINEDGSADDSDWVMLTLENGVVSMFPGGTANITNVRVKSGFYITHVRPYGGWDGSGSPDLFCEVAQR